MCTCTILACVFMYNVQYLSALWFDLGPGDDSSEFEEETQLLETSGPSPLRPPRAPVRTCEWDGCWLKYGSTSYFQVSPIIYRLTHFYPILQ